MEQNRENRQQVIQEYKAVVEPLLRYLPWLEKNAGRGVSYNYQGRGLSKSSISFPVYDGTLLNFVKEAEATPLMNRNYAYVYTRNRIRNHEDERRLIAAAQLTEWDILEGILSKYVLEGRRKANLWGEAVRESIFVLVLRKMRQIIEYWDRAGK